ncbi:hypothetical protein [Frankia sp. KB5]|uniref:hypothetical protein n=1 Tax=Frankia sp. KB5 TaxID=683318 RepID=UPI000A101165|nr:hypothetical protein [Frankia sp. KB5]ORT53987.1 hypothetical protein KBI5_05490 [Frankia sp. KB5]
MNDDQFTQLFKYMTEQFQAVRSEIAEVKDDVNRVRNVLDGVVGDIQDLKTELGATGVQLDRHDQAISQLASHTGVRLQYE